jgi:hypothetical protein
MEVLKNGDPNLIYKGKNRTNAYYQIECPFCNAVLKFTDDEVIAGNINCPECTCQMSTHGNCTEYIDDINNVKFPDDFDHFPKTKELSDKEISEINRIVKKHLYNLVDAEVGQFYYNATGSYFIFVAKHKDEYAITVARDYYDTFIFRCH